MFAPTTTTIPGPRGLPLRGHLVQFQRNPLSLLQHSAYAYGDVVRLRLGPRDAYLISNPDFIQEILITNQRNFPKVSGRSLPLFVGNGLLRSEGNFHLRQRRLMQPAFHRQEIASYGDIMTSYTQQMLAAWHDGQTLDLLDEMMSLTLLIVAQCLFSVDISQETDIVGQALTDLLHQINAWIGQPVRAVLAQRLPTPARKRFQQAAAALDTVVYNIINERRHSGLHQPDLLSTLLQMRDEEGQPMSDQQLRDEVMTLLLAGHETTANALTWTFYLLARHPEIRDKLEQELKTVLGTQSPTYQDLGQLPYVNMVIKEAMRLYPPAWTQARQVDGGYPFGDYIIPAGSTIFLSQYVMHRHPDYWVQPEQFIPERFTPEQEKARHRFVYFPFGAGVRQCIGQHFAMMEAALILATISQKVRFDVDLSQQVVPQPLVTLRPKNGLSVQVNARTQ